MFNRFEGFRHRRLRMEPMPPITDPFRQVHELTLHPVSRGAHSFMGYEKSWQEPRREWKVVPITEPHQFFTGLNTLINDVQMNNTESNPLAPSPYDPYEGTRYYLKNQKKYQRQLEGMYRKYSDIHKGVLAKFTDEEKKRLAETLTEAKDYQPTDSVRTNPNWRAGSNHHTGLPYDVHVDLETGKWEKEIFPKK